MRILFLSELFYPHGGGAEFATYLIAKNLSEAKHDVKVITNRFNDEDGKSVEEGFLVVRKNLLSNTRSMKYSILMKLNVMHQKWMRESIDWADIVYIPRYWYSSIPIIKKLEKPVVTHLHDYIACCPVAILYDPRNNKICEKTNGACSPLCIYSYERLNGRDIPYSIASSIFNSTFGKYMGWTIRKSDAIVCVSDNQKKLITNMKPELEEKITVIHNPLPTLQYIPLEKKGFAYFGGSSHLKGFQLLMRSIKTTSNSDVRLKATGFKDLISTHKGSIDSRIEFFGWVKGIELESVYKDIHTVIVPSITPEPAPYVVYEALLRGRLLIASNIGGIPEQINGYDGCFLFEPGNQDQLAEKIEATQSIDVKDAREITLKNREKLLAEDQNKKSLESFEALMNKVSYCAP